MRIATIALALLATLWATSGLAAYAQQGQAAPAYDPARAQMQARIEELERLLREATGQTERLRFDLDKTRAALAKQEKLLDDVLVRMRALELRLPQAAEGGGAGAPGLAPAPGESADAGPRIIVPSVAENAAPKNAAAGPPNDPGAAKKAAEAAAAAGDKGSLGVLRAVALPDDPAQAFGLARNLMFNGRYGDAEQAFRSFLQKFPNAEQTGDARYWLGESHRIQGNYADAASAYVDMLKAKPNSPLAPDAMVWLADSLRQINQRDQACAALRTFRQTFPAAHPVTKTRADAVSRQAQCAA